MAYLDALAVTSDQRVVIVSITSICGAILAPRIHQIANGSVPSVAATGDGANSKALIVWGDSETLRGQFISPSLEPRGITIDSLPGFEFGNTEVVGSLEVIGNVFIIDSLPGFEYKNTEVLFNSGTNRFMVLYTAKRSFECHVYSQQIALDGRILGERSEQGRCDGDLDRHGHYTSGAFDGYNNPQAEVLWWHEGLSNGGKAVWVHDSTGVVVPGKEDRSGSGFTTPVSSAMRSSSTYSVNYVIVFPFRGDRKSVV